MNVTRRSSADERYLERKELALSLAASELERRGVKHDRIELITFTDERWDALFYVWSGPHAQVLGIELPAEAKLGRGGARPANADDETDDEADADEADADEAEDVAA